jgi:hypothetical protein
MSQPAASQQPDGSQQLFLQQKRPLSRSRIGVQHRCLQLGSQQLGSQQLGSQHSGSHAGSQQPEPQLVPQPPSLHLSKGSSGVRQGLQAGSQHSGSQAGSQHSGSQAGSQQPWPQMGLCLRIGSSGLRQIGSQQAGSGAQHLGSSQAGSQAVAQGSQQLLQANKPLRPANRSHGLQQG